MARNSMSRQLAVALLLLVSQCSCASSYSRLGHNTDGSKNDPRLLTQLVPEDGGSAAAAYERINGVWRVADIRQPQQPPAQSQPQHPAAAAPATGPKLFVDLATRPKQPASEGRAQQLQPQQVAITTGVGVGGSFLQQQMLQQRQAGGLLQKQVLQQQQQAVSEQQHKPAVSVGALAGETLTGGLFWSGARPTVNAFNTSYNPDSDFLIPRGYSNRAGPSATVRVVDSPNLAAAEFGSQSSNVLVVVDVSTSGAIQVTASVFAATAEPSQGMRLTLAGPKLSTFTSIRLLNSTFGASSTLNATLANSTVTLTVARINTTAVRTFGATLQLSTCEPGSGPCCNRNYQFEAAGTVCRPAAHTCDVADVCSGHSVDCGNQLAADGAVCSWAMPTIEPPVAPFAGAGGLGGRRSVRRFSAQRQLGQPLPALSRNEAGLGGGVGENMARVATAAEAAGVTLCRGTCMRGVCRIQVGPTGSCLTDDDADARPVQSAERPAIPPWDLGRQQLRW